MPRQAPARQTIPTPIIALVAVAGVLTMLALGAGRLYALTLATRTSTTTATTATTSVPAKANETLTRAEFRAAVTGKPATK